MKGEKALLVVVTIIISTLFVTFTHNALVSLPSEEIMDGPVQETTIIFTFEKERYSVTASIPEGRLEAYEKIPISRFGFFHAYRFPTPSDPVVIDVASQLSALSVDMTDQQRVNFVLRYTQAFYYVEDTASHNIREYFQFPIETLHLRSGDCEDLAILYVSLMRALGYDAVMLLGPHHMAAGVAIEGLSGHYVARGGVNYYTAEPTTSQAVGKMPADDLIAFVDSPLLSMLLTALMGSFFVLMIKEIKYPNPKHQIHIGKLVWRSA